MYGDIAEVLIEELLHHGWAIHSTLITNAVIRLNKALNGISLLMLLFFNDTVTLVLFCCVWVIFMHLFTFIYIQSVTFRKHH